MGHYALINENNIVEQVIVGPDENQGVDYEQLYGQQFNMTCKRTSYNTIGNTHKNEKEPFRKNFAGIGYTYDNVSDAFIAPQPYPSWILDDDYLWQPPIPYPSNDGYYIWDEDILNWIEK